MNKRLKYRLVDLFLKVYTKKKDFEYSRAQFKKLEEKEFKNIIIYSTTALGDFLMNTPAIHAIRKRFKNSSITLICHHNFKSFLENGTDWDKVITWNNKVNHIPNLLKDIKETGTPDLAIILHSHSPYDYLSAIMSGAKFVFRDNYNSDELINKWLTNYVEDFNGHIIQRKLELIKPLGCDLSLKSSVEMHVPCSINSVREYYKYIGFQMGASSYERCWPVKNFVQVALYILKIDHNAKILLIGSPKDIHLQEKFMELLPNEYHSRIDNLIGKTSLTELTQKISELDLLITGDTGPMHIAIALKIPTISLFVTAVPHATGPYQDLDLHKIILGSTMPLNDNGHIMSSISSDVVISEINYSDNNRLLNIE
ncbi:ADP-heptose--LPS heptosyltransferase [Xenorhabdus stockiae]|uniref:ADP-heptose--LPS heptosyltransferase n=1 Tax=Xenorhabdus stockiae TaxID=351614 RepID=A0A2D0KRX9_9GAMM|nr:glycosyltransferase family 9 protein [Xenorhabdus stockiae]PHM66196.1 ADP-heptose--LPS heptosyltransferase [Xenorhabdus stockiae]